MKTLLALLLLIPSLLQAKNEIIYCYETEKFTDLTDTDKILYLEIDDKKEQLKTLKTYSDFLGISHFYHLDGDFLKEQEEQEYSVEVLRFDKHHISLKISFLQLSFKSQKKEKFIAYRELDRISGLMVLKSGIIIDENGDEFVYGSYEDNTEDDKFYKKNDEKKFNKHVYITKSLCEKSKEL